MAGISKFHLPKPPAVLQHPQFIYYFSNVYVRIKTFYFKDASCPVLPKLPQLHQIPDLSEYIYNDTVSFQCDVGFLLSGPALITCTTDNRQSPVYWNGKQPNCTGM